jgi:peroxiredoxin
MNASNMLHPGDRFPPVSMTLPGGESLQLPGALNGHFAVVLLFRGSWCPYCNAQLRAFERARDRLEELGVRVVALSVDDEAATRALIDKHALTFPSATAPTRRPCARQPARSSTATRSTCSRPGSSSIPPAA